MRLFDYCGDCPTILPRGANKPKGETCARRVIDSAREV